MIDIRNLTGGVIGIDFTLHLWQLGVVFCLGLLAGFVYNRWIVLYHEAGKYMPTWGLVVIGVLLGLGLLSLIAWPVAILAMFVYAGLGIPLAWGDNSREREAARDYAEHLRRKNKMMKHVGGVDNK